MKNIQIAASILSADFAYLAKDIKKVLNAGIDEIHFDVMDHHFVPNLSFGSIICEALRNAGISAPIDVHLMVTDPEKYITPFAKAGANRLSFHAETVSDTKKMCALIHEAGMQVGLAFNPDKPVTIEKNIWPLLDMILIMSVFAGFGGQKFIPDSIEKIRTTHKLIQHNNPNILLSVDGGIKVDNIRDVVDAGAHFIVIGSGLFETNDYQERMIQLRQTI